MTTNVNVVDFSTFLHKPVSQCKLDLSNASLIECIDKMIEIKQRTSPRYGKGYSSVRKSINDIERQTNSKIMPLHVNEEFWSLYIPYLYSCNLKAQSIKTMCGQVKFACSWASKRGAKIDDAFDQFEPPKAQIQTIALTQDDLSRIFHKELSTIPRRKQHLMELDRVRDMFCLMSNLGLRFSDAKRLCKDHFKDGVVLIMQQKTKMYARIDINKMCICKDMLMTILEKYDFQAPYSGDLSNFDKYLHEFMGYCGFEEDITFEEEVNGMVEKVTKKKKDLITSHTARRTFVVNAALRSVPYLEIMRATGHKTWGAFNKYLRYFN